MDKLRKLLERYKKAEEFFESDVDMQSKEAQIENLKILINLIDTEYKLLNLTENELRYEMIKANILVEV